MASWQSSISALSPSTCFAPRAGDHLVRPPRPKYTITRHLCGLSDALSHRATGGNIASSIRRLRPSLARGHRIMPQSIWRQSRVLRPGLCLHRFRETSGRHFSPSFALCGPLSPWLRASLARWHGFAAPSYAYAILTARTPTPHWRCPEGAIPACGRPGRGCCAARARRGRRSTGRRRWRYTACRPPQKSSARR